MNEKIKIMNEKIKILIFVEQIEQAIHRVAFELILKAREITRGKQAEIDCLFLGPENIALEELCYRGADKVYLMQDRCFRYPEEELFKNNIVPFIKEHQPDIVLIGATNFGRSLAPRIAAALKTGLTADCTDLRFNDNHEFEQVRPAFSDNILAHILTAASPKMATVRYKEFAEAPRDAGRKAVIEQVGALVSSNAGTRIINTVADDFCGITDAEIVVAGGRGVRKKEDLNLLRDLADMLGGQLGVSRALVDMGFCGSSRQIGYSGNRVKPRIYIACGISGAPQHLAGMKEAEMIIAINTDPSAPIFSVCDYGIVGDLYDVIPRLLADLNQWRKVKQVD